MDNTTVHAIGVRVYNHGLRWSLEARRNGEVIAITCDSTSEGTLIDIQSESHIDSTLDVSVRQCIGDTVALHAVLRSLAAINGKQLGRSDRLRFAA
jgi:hypothetical protein